MRARLRHLVERVAIGSGLVSRRRRRRAGLAILAYHNVVSSDLTGRGDASLHISFDRFRRHLDHLQGMVSFVALDGVAHPAGTQLGVAMTFDDAYSGAVEIALPELASRGIPATVFVSPALLDGPGFWWDMIAPPSGHLDQTTRIRALEDLEGRQAEVLARWPPGQDLPEPLRPATTDQLLSSAELPGVTFGSHAWSHPNLARLHGSPLSEELQRPRAWLETRFGSRSLDTHISLPYGLGGDETIAAARAAGYEFVYRIGGGVVETIEDGQFVFPRINVPAGLSPAGLELRVSGFLASSP